MRLGLLSDFIMDIKNWIYNWDIVTFVIIVIILCLLICACAVSFLKQVIGKAKFKWLQLIFLAILIALLVIILVIRK